MGSTKHNATTGERNTLRKNVLQERDALAKAEISHKSAAIISHLLNLPEISNANSCLIYMHFRSEVETEGLVKKLIASGKTVSLPLTRVDTRELVAVQITDITTQVAPGYCGIPEPLPERVKKAPLDPRTLDVVVVPGSVFDRAGGRLGYGGGYYDRFFTNKAPGAVRVGLAFELQLVETVPLEPHDQRMDYVVTEKGVYDCRRVNHA